MPTCPNGHQSGSDDWCEVCGHRMAGAVPPPPPPPPAPGYGYPQGPGPGAPQGPGAAPGSGYGFPPPGPDATAQAEICPQCRTPREAMAPFCEECRWNYLTNTATSYTPVAPQNSRPGPGGPGPGAGLNLPPGFQAQQQGPPAPPGQAGQARDPYEYQPSRPSQMNRPAEPLAPEQSGGQAPPQAFQQQPPFQQQPGPPPSFQQQAPPAPPAPPRRDRGGDDDWMLPPPSQQQPPQQHQQQPPHQQSQPPQGQPQQQQPPQQHYQAPAPAAGWTATVGPDREYFMAMMQRSGPDAAGLNLPAYSPEQQRPLTGNQVTIGRRRHSTGEAPDIDLSVPPEDPGVSHQHAVLVQQPDGSWAVVDQNSTNGTTVNGAEDPIQPYVPVPLQDGDRVHVGAWTTITVRRG
ncbi:forkhead-associated protein [Streptomyces agglomeratus]|uniref:Forkhead-associated protein n=1 Tax=Streptomyces agglomeratus TaxID=285458 RepID=A0A1E5PBD5_9ACTN|nr:FHA domain-containing protein [Streptomyces agglomeratus]OEJ26839.1 forkhead-associated protein [Streptomyces agglomeratus]OEJ39114.1 forkhead-associated protein [Streptomyces agglomeratus]OEJ46504.1 forkhead-associated protein [Streptomyces agglomeratus]